MPRFVNDFFEKGVRQMTANQPNYHRAVLKFQMMHLRMECPQLRAKTKKHIGNLLIKEFRSKAAETVIEPYQQKLREVAGEFEI